MAIRGQTRDVNLPPVHRQDISDSEAAIPNVLRLSNGRLTAAGNWTKRSGIQPWKDNAVHSPIMGLIPVGDLFAINEIGQIFALNPDPALIPGSTNLLKPMERPTWIAYQDRVIIANGRTVVSLKPGARTSEDLKGGPPGGKFVATLDSFVIISGFGDNLDFRFSGPGNAEEWPPENANSLNKQGDQIRMMKTLRRELWFWRDNQTEIWGNIGGNQVFVRRGVIPMGTLAGHSVVEANGAFYWWGQDGEIYVATNGAQAIPVPSEGRTLKMFNDRLGQIKNLEHVYGAHFQNEGVIRWVAPIEGITIVYDYKSKLLSEDYSWEGACESRLRFNSFMSVGNSEYVGDFQRGRVFEWTPGVENDRQTNDFFGVPGHTHPIRVERRFQFPVAEGNQYARIHRMRFRFERGVGAAEAKESKLLVRWAVDQADFVPFREVSLGSLGDRQPYIDLWHLGIGREITFDMVETGRRNFLMSAAQITVEPLGT